MSELHEENGHHSFRDWLDSWHLAAAFAVALAILLGLWSIKLTADTRHLAESNRRIVDANQKIIHDLRQVQKDQRERDRAANQNQVDQCLAAQAQGPATVQILEALRSVIPIEETRQKIDDYIALTQAQITTHADCKLLAKKLGVKVSE